MDELELISVYLIKGKKYLNDSWLHHIYNESFKAWHATWDKTYKLDFHADRTLLSDDFTRQDEILVITYAGECAALCFFSHADMNDFTAKYDSYFQCWPIEAINGLCMKGNDILVCSQFTVCEKFRKEGLSIFEGTHWKNILMEMLTRYFLTTNKSAMTGNTRVTKGVDKLTYRFGAIGLKEKMEYLAGGDITLVDLVAFFPENVKKAIEENPHAKLYDIIWKSRNTPYQLKKVA